MSVTDSPRMLLPGRRCAGIVFMVSLIAVTVFIAPALRRGGPEVISTAVMAPMPWSCVGGCGFGGSGTGGGGGVKWVGQGVSGGLIDAEIMFTASVGENYNQKQVKTRLSMKPRYTTTVGLTVPVVSKIGNLKPADNFDNKTEVTGGLSDISIDVSQSIGMQGQYSLNLSLSLPTGQYDIKRGKENEMQYLPVNLQKGSGLYSATLGVGMTKDVEDGILLLDVSFFYPFAVNFRGKNKFINNRPDQYNHLVDELEIMDDTQKQRFEYYFKPYGENDLGAYTPPSATIMAYYGYRGVENFVHSWGVTFTPRFGVAWIPSFSANSYDPFPDPDHKMWSASLNYGLEFSRPKYPIFIAVSLPINDTPDGVDAMGKWDGPDWDDLRQSWTVGVGVRSTMF